MLDLTVSIISHGHGDYIRPCLDSLFRHTSTIDFEVYLVLNLPEEGLEDLVRQSFPQVRIVKNPDPLGFSKNNNQVYRTTKSRYFLLLNPDTILLNDAICRLVAFLDEHPEGAVCGGKLVYPDGRLQLSCRSFPTLRSVMIRRTPLRYLWPNSRATLDHTLADCDHTMVREVDWVIGACLMARRSAVDAVGLMDEKLPLFCEDIDWCYRLRKAGWKVFYVPDALVEHDLDDTRYQSFWGHNRILHYRSMFRYWKKNMLFGGKSS